MGDIEKRKVQHIQLALDPESQIRKVPFLDFKIPYLALPEINFEDVSSKTKLFNKTVSQPLIIASMTGGTNHAKTINTNIALAANECNIAFGVGSQRIALELEDAKESFALTRKYAPKAVIFANMGAIQLNFGKTIEDYKKVVDMVKADALYLHINALQEVIQPEGDTNFKGLIEKIANLIKEIKVPVFAKEVGHGLDRNTINDLLEIGIRGIDVAGANGTSWAWIEAKRKSSENLADWFKDYGLTLEESLSNAKSCIRIHQAKNSIRNSEITLVASGGIRSPIEGYKAILNGAQFYSAAYPFLKPALESPEKLISAINEWQKGLKTVLFMAGKTSI